MLVKIINYKIDPVDQIPAQGSGLTKLTTHVKIEREAGFDNVQENIGIIYD